MTVNPGAPPHETMDERMALRQYVEIDAPNWVANVSVLLKRRRILGRAAAVALLCNFAIVLLIPKQFESTARIMPPESSSSGAALLSALAGHALGGRPAAQRAKIISLVTRWSRG